MTKRHVVLLLCTLFAFGKADIKSDAIAQAHKEFLKITSAGASKAEGLKAAVASVGK
jgi:hypothetical protein